MTRLQQRARSLAVIACALGSVPAFAQNYPERVIEMVNPYPPGGATDTMGRALAEAMGRSLGQHIVFINRPGANGAIGTASVARAAPDGYTLLFTAAVSMVVNPLTQKQTGYTFRSFDHLCQTFKNEMVIIARPDSPFKSVGDLVQAAKSKPGALSYGILGIGSIPHLAMVELSQAAGVQFNAIPFKGDADVLQQVHGGHTDFGAVVLASAAKSGLRILGLFSNARNPAVPDVPTVKEQGYPVAPFSPGGVSAPAGLPPPVKAKLETACSEAAQTEAYAKLMRGIFQPTDYYADAAVYAKTLEQDAREKERLLRQLGLIN